MSPGIFFKFNGHQYFTHYDLTLLDLVQYFDYKKSLLVLEYNNFICHKDKWNRIFVKNNDQIEIVTIVGGG